MDQQWIRINRDEDLPKDMRRLWVYDGKSIYVARYDSAKQVFYNIEGSITNDGFFHKNLDGITHWMPVPNAPKD